jgi:hypothetical protein
MKNKIIAIALFVVFVLGACADMQPLVTTTYVPPTPSQLNTLTVSTFAPIPFNTPVPVSPAPSSTPSPTMTATPTLDYVALGLPSPTATPTFDYDGLASYYLTPFTPIPRPTGISSLTPTVNIENILSSVVMRKVTPEPPPDIKMNDTGGYQNYPEWASDFVQSATDLMNYTNGDKKLYLQYIEDWVPRALKYSPDDWFLENDYDNDGESEWLVSFPTQNSNDGLFHCGDMVRTYCARYFFLFEKIGSAYYPIKAIRTAEEKVVLVKDLNNNHLLEVVFQADPCGTACSTYLHIMEWDGDSWKDYWISAEGSQVTFADLDGNETIEISLKHSTGAMSKYNSPYPFREGLVDVYGWQNGRYELVDQIYPPTDSIFATIFDIAHALEYKNAELALKHIYPVMDSLDLSCDRMKTYVGIQAMLAYAIQGDLNGMKSTLTKLEKYCDQPNNAYVPAAKILWLSYEKSHDPISACQAMEHFLWNEYNRENGRWAETLFIDERPTNRPSCPRE